MAASVWLGDEREKRRVNSNTIVDGVTDEGIVHVVILAWT